MKKPINVLIVEDNEDDAELLRRMLAKGDYVAHCRHVQTKETFVDALDEKAWDIVLCDYRLPGFTGIDALNIYKKRELDIPFIFVSGTMGEEVAVDAMTEGAHDYVMKNNMTRLLPAIDRELKDAEVRRERRQAIESLRTSEEKFRGVIETALEAVWFLDSEFKTTEVNDAAITMLGYTQEELIGRPFIDLVFDEDRPAQVQEFQRRKRGINGQYERRLVCKDGSVKWVFLSAKAIIGAQGAFVGTFAMITDITERKRSEERLRASEAYYRTLTEASPDALVIVDLKGVLQFATPKAVAMFGIPQDKATLGASIFTWISPDDREMIKKRLQEVVSGRWIPGPREVRLLRDDGTLFWGEINSSTIVDDAGTIIGLLIVCRDISDRKRAEELLRESEEKYRLLAESSPEMIYLIGKDGRITYVNTAAAAQFHVKPSDLVGKHLTEVFPADLARQNLEGLQKVIDTKKASIRELVQHFPTGAKWVEARLSPVLRENGEVIAVLGISSDISERKLAEEASDKAAEALRHSEARYRAVLQSANDAIVTADSSGNISGWNKGAERVFGYGYAEVVGQPLTNLMPPDYRSKHVDGLKRFQASGKPNIAGNTVEMKGLRNDGTEFPMELSLAAWEVSEGHFYSAIIRDITERQRTEAAVRDSELRFRSVWERSVDGMRLTDYEGRTIDVNEAFCRLAKMPREQLVGETFSRIYKEQNPDETIEVYHRRFASGEIVPRLAATIRLWNDDELDVEISNSFIDQREGGKYLLSVFRDVTLRNKAEKRLEEERTLLRTIIDAIPDEIAVKDTERRFMVVNAGTISALKRASADEIVGKKDEDLIPEHLVKRAIWEENAVLAVGGHARNRVSDRINPETGEIERSLLISKIPLKNDEGKIIGLVGINRDITELKQAEEMLQKERTLLLTLIESIPDEVCLKDLRHQYLVANRASIKALGAASLEALMGKTDRDFVPSAYVELHFAEEDAIVASGVPVINREQTRFNPDTGEIEKCVLTTKVPVRDNTGKTIGILVVNRNITDRRRAEEGLRGSEEKFRLLFEESKDCIYISSADGKFLDINAAGVDLFGYESKEALLQRDLGNDLYDDSQRRAEFLSRMNQQGFVKDFEVTVKRKDGRKLSVIETATAVRNKQGKIILLRGTIRDVTSQKQLERQVGQAQKMESLGLLAGGIAHDFNNILGIILGHTAVVERSGKDPALLKDSVGEITKAVQRGASLVRQILTFARRSDATDEPIRVNATIKELAKMIDDTFPKTITLSLNLDKTLPIIMMDQTQLHQALLNLCVNARDAITDSSTGSLGRGEIKIQTRLVSNSELRKKFSEASAPEYVCISVSDTGKGMDEETKQKIYEPFFTTKERGKGTGLGLSVVYGIIKSHHGHIEVESDIGQGATFRMYLPVTEALATPALPQEEGAPADIRGKETILLVEDEQNLLGLMKAALERAGYTVLTASDGLSAIKMFSLNKEAIGLVLTDLGLPKLDGAAVFTSLMDIDPKVKIILASGYLDPNLKSNLLRSGAKEFIQKPYSPNLVLRKIREVLDAAL